MLLKYGTNNENTKLFLLHLIKVSDDGLAHFLGESLTALLKHSLHNPAAKFVKTKCHNILLDGWDNGAHARGLCWVTHLYDDLLHDMITVEVEWTVLNSFGIDQLLHQLFLLAIGEHFEACLKYSATMLVSWEVIDISSTMCKDNVQVLAVNSSNLLNFLYNVVAKWVLYELIKSYGRIFQQIVEEALLFVHRNSI